MMKTPAKEPEAVPEPKAAPEPTPQRTSRIARTAKEPEAVTCYVSTFNRILTKINRIGTYF